MPRALRESSLYLSTCATCFTLQKACCLWVATNNETTSYKVHFAADRKLGTSNRRVFNYAGPVQVPHLLKLARNVIFTVCDIYYSGEVKVKALLIRNHYASKSFDGIELAQFTSKRFPNVYNNEEKNRVRNRSKGRVQKESSSSLKKRNFELNLSDNQVMSTVFM